MKSVKSFCFLITAILILSLAAGCSSVGANSDSKEKTTEKTTEKTIELKFADFLPPNDPMHKDFMVVWMKEIEKATDGRVKFTDYPGGTLLAGPDIVGGIESGVTETGQIVPGYTPTRFPTLLGFELGGIEYKSSRAGSFAVRDAIEQLKPKELEGTKVMFIYNAGPCQLMTKKPVTKLEDLKGMQIRASGSGVKTIEALGAIPVAMPVTEAYEALSKGIVDGILVSAQSLKAFRFAEVIKHSIDAPFFYTSSFIVGMNLNTWNSLPLDIQKIIEQVNEKIYNEVAIDFFDEEIASGKQFAVEKYGVNIITLSEEEKQRWLKRLEPVFENYVKDMNKIGLDGQKVLDTIIPLTKKYNNQY